jgi:hypothetical protein
MKQMLVAIGWIVATAAVGAASQVITTRTASERRAVTLLKLQLVENNATIRALEAEVRTRARAPELERWNAEFFQLSAPQPAQLLQSPVQLAAFVAPAPAAPQPRLAVVTEGPATVEPRRDGPVPVSGPGARVVKASLQGPAVAGTAGFAATAAAVAALPDTPPSDTP